MKKKSKNYSFYSSKINKREKTRKKNNKNWMDLLRLSFKHNPQQAKKILKGIFVQDKKVSKLVKDLLK